MKMKFHLTCLFSSAAAMPSIIWLRPKAISIDPCTFAAVLRLFQSAAGANARCSHFAHIPHCAAQGTATSRGAERKSRKTIAPPCRQRTPVAIIAPARAFRGYGGIDTPMLLVLLASKEHNPFVSEQSPRYSSSRIKRQLLSCAFWFFFPKKNTVLHS